MLRITVLTLFVLVSGDVMFLEEESSGEVPTAEVPTASSTPASSTPADITMVVPIAEVPTASSEEVGTIVMKPGVTIHETVVSDNYLRIECTTQQKAVWYINNKFTEQPTLFISELVFDTRLPHEYRGIVQDSSLVFNKSHVGLAGNYTCYTDTYKSTLILTVDLNLTTLVVDRELNVTVFTTRIFGYVDIDEPDPQMIFVPTTKSAPRPYKTDRIMNHCVFNANHAREYRIGLYDARTYDEGYYIFFAKQVYAVGKSYYRPYVFWIRIIWTHDTETYPCSYPFESYYKLSLKNVKHCCKNVCRPALEAATTVKPTTVKPTTVKPTTVKPVKASDTEFWGALLLTQAITAIAIIFIIVACWSSKTIRKYCTRLRSNEEPVELEIRPVPPRPVPGSPRPFSPSKYKYIV